MMVERVRAGNAVKDRYKGRAFELGRADCARLAATVLRELGHKPGLSRAGAYRGALGVKRALRSLGYAGTHDWLDSIKTICRIPPSRVLIGDIVGFPCEAFGVLLTVYMGNNAVLGFHESLANKNCEIVRLTSEELAQTICWKVDPCSYRR